MAKVSIKARQKKREKTVKKFAEKRAALKAAGDYAGLDKLPKNASPVRLKNRCQLTIAWRYQQSSPASPYPQKWLFDHL